MREKPCVVAKFLARSQKVIGMEALTGISKKRWDWWEVRNFCVDGGLEFFLFFASKGVTFKFFKKLLHKKSMFAQNFPKPFQILLDPPPTSNQHQPGTKELDAGMPNIEVKIIGNDEA